VEVKLPSYGLFLSYQSGDILKAKVSFLFACMAEYALGLILRSGKWEDERGFFPHTLHPTPHTLHSLSSQRINSLK
jgi:hypothetical protein